MTDSQLQGSDLTGWEARWAETLVRARGAEAERDRYREALELIINDSRRPELANAEYLRGIAMEALD